MRNVLVSRLRCVPCLWELCDGPKRRARVLSQAWCATTLRWPMWKYVYGGRVSGWAAAHAGRDPGNEHRWTLSAMPFRSPETL